MKILEEHVIDRSKFPPGPWMDEPDKVQWKDPATGLPCLARRTPAGYLCGYVGVHAGHPWWGRDPDSVGPLRAHRDVNYAAPCEGDICHEPEEGEPPVWWFGFDCGHVNRDLVPAFEPILARIEAEMPKLPDPLGLFKREYRDLAYVRRECSLLAAQLAKIK